MGDLILFRPVELHGRTHSPEGGAQIVFFTGVRYQRAREDALPSAARAPGAPRQDGDGGGVRRGGRRRRR